MDDRDFFDHLYQMWARTTLSDKAFWDFQDTGETGFDLHANLEDGERVFIGYFDNEADADFITALHGCLPDLVRRLHAALDEADASDYDRDSRECRIAELEMEVGELRSVVSRQRDELQAAANDLAWRER